MSTSSAFAFSSSVRFRSSGNPVPSLPAGHPSMSPPTAVAPLSRQIANSPPSTTVAQQQIRPPHPSEQERRYAASPPTFTRPVCNTCHINVVNVREGSINFCERCFQDALRRRGRRDSTTANRPTCRICRANHISVRDRDMSYCERCWQETLRRREGR